VVKREIRRALLAGFVVFTLVTTSFAGAFATSALAATFSEDVQVSNDSPNKTVVGGLVALGLIALLSRHSGSSSSTDKAATPPEQTTSSQASPSQSQSTPTKQPASTPKTNPASGTTSSGLTAAEQQAFNLLNADRTSNGLPALKLNAKLTSLADSYAQDMINRHFFAHTNPEGLSPFDRMRQAGIPYTYAGENLAINSSVPNAEVAFMNSPGHRANILDANYNQVGLGVEVSPSGQVYVVQEFTN
jgi:uncharacterized protein YkwD